MLDVFPPDKTVHCRGQLTIALYQSKFAARVLVNQHVHAITLPDQGPFDRDLQLAVIDAAGKVHTLVFPCRRVDGRWLDVRTERTIEIYPTHWQEWSE